MTAAAPRPAGCRRRCAASAALLAATALSAATPAAAQVGVSVSAVSDDVFRGVSLSDRRPAASLDVSYDRSEGLYAGMSASGVATAHAGVQWLGLQEYAGYTRRLGSGVTADVGLTHADYSEYYGGHASADYSEAYIGLATRHFATHLYYSPRYFGYPHRSLYADLEGSMRPRPDWRFSARVGVLNLISGARPPGTSDTRLDWRLGVARDFKGFGVQLAVTGGEREYGPPRQTVVFGLTHSF